jgi:hypothetical protein
MVSSKVDNHLHKPSCLSSKSHYRTKCLSSRVSSNASPSAVRLLEINTHSKLPRPIHVLIRAATVLAAATASSKPRMNEVQVIGTHNSYHREVTLAERKILEAVMTNPQNLYYSHATIEEQLSYQSVRGLEIDLWADSKGGMFANPLGRRLGHLPAPEGDFWQKPGTKVVHVQDFDVTSSCSTLVECMTQVRDWSKKNPGHVLLPIMMEFKFPGMSSLFDSSR